MISGTPLALPILETISAQSPSRKEPMNALKVLLAMTLALPSIAEARPEIVDLDLNEQEFNSAAGEDTVPLKALINRYYGGRVDLTDYDLQAVIVKAKSRQGGGRISLLVGGRESAAQVIAGNPRDYATRRVGFNRYDFAVPGATARGVWQLKLQGNIKIDTIRVRMRLEGGGGGGGGLPGRYDSFRIGKVGSGNPFGGWDTDIVQSTLAGRFLGVELRLDQGIGLEVRDLEVVCRDGRVCFRQALNDNLEDRRPLRVLFRAPLDVKSVQVRIKSVGISIPGSKAEVFLLR